jgi:hypothetical protein
MFLLWLNNLNMGASPSGGPAATIVSIDPRAGTIASLDVDPRAGTILDDDYDPPWPDPRAGTIIS